MSSSREPGIVIYEDDRLVAPWRLTAPLSDLARARELLWRFALNFKRDRQLADLAEALIALPGTMADSVRPAQVVSAERWRGLHRGHRGRAPARRVRPLSRRLKTRLAVPVAIQNCSLTSLQQRLFKIGGRLIRSVRYFTLQLAERYLTRPLFRQIVARIEQLAWHPT